jgi:three-Cys-motif partner protein
MTTRRATSRLQLDVVGQWSELKINIIRKYAHAYTTVLHSHRLRPIYIDGFAGAGKHISKSSGNEIDGSPSVAFAVEPPFAEFHLVDLDGHKVENLRLLAQQHPHVTVHHGDCNEVLLNEVFPATLRASANRALVILDPYGLHLDWEVIEAAGKSGKAEIFLHFPVADMHRNVFWHNPTGVDPEDLIRMNRFWGDETWHDSVYTEQPTLFGPEMNKDPDSTRAIVKSFQLRLKQAAGFEFIPEPVPMRNARNGTIYFLFFATQNKTGNKIVSEIFAKYKREGAF